MIRVFLIFIIALVITLVSLLVNNSSVCCDQIYQAGWPFPFYGGSGGLAGFTRDTLDSVNFIRTFMFWSLVSVLVAFIVFQTRRSRNKRK